MAMDCLLSWHRRPRSYREAEEEVSVPESNICDQRESVADTASSVSETVTPNLFSEPEDVDSLPDDSLPDDSRSEDQVSDSPVGGAADDAAMPEAAGLEDSPGAESVSPNQFSDSKVVDSLPDVSLPDDIPCNDIFQTDGSADDTAMPEAMGLESLPPRPGQKRPGVEDAPPSVSKKLLLLDEMPSEGVPPDGGPPLIVSENAPS